MALPDLSPQKLMTLMQLLEAYERGELRYKSQPARSTADWPRVLLGKADATINGTSTHGITNPASGAVSVWGWDAAGNLVDLGWNVTAYNVSTVAVTTGKWLQLKREFTGRVLIDFEACD